MTGPAPLVFFDIAAPDLAGQRAFYSALLGWEIAEDGSFTVPAATAMPGTLRVEPPEMGPVTERVLYFGVPDVAASQARAVELGGSVVFPRLEVPGVVILGMIADPAGNRLGLVEIADGKPIVPPLP